MMHDDTPSSAIIDVELADWLLAHDRGLTQGEQLAFDAWLGTSSAHSLAWAEAAEMWESFDAHSSDDALATMLAEARGAEPKRFHILKSTYGLVAGGGLLLAAVLVWGLVGPEKLGLRNDAPPAGQHYATGAKPESVTLADGSHLDLDARSEITFVHDKGQRLATIIQGRVLLEVRHNPAQPFRVHAGEATITDVGTRFGVDLDHGALTVSLMAGEVSISDPVTSKNPITLKPGQKFARPADQPGTIENIAIDRQFAWPSGYMEFDKSSLADAVKQMNRYSEKTVAIEDPRLGNLLVTGRFKIGDTERFAKILEITYPVKLISKPDGKMVLTIRNRE